MAQQQFASTLQQFSSAYQQQPQATQDQLPPPYPNITATLAPQTQMTQPRPQAPPQNPQAMFPVQRPQPMETQSTDVQVSTLVILELLQFLMRVEGFRHARAHL